MSTAMMIVPLLIIWNAAFATADEAILKVIPDVTGNFTITFDGKPWLSGSEYRVAGLSSAEGTLVLLSQVNWLRKV